MRTTRSLQERAARVDLAVFDQLLACAGEEALRPGAESPDASAAG
ncbi:MAG TPA: hypothetical protein VIH59_20330 [Candidatus Tectomicrobia bacterium]